MIPVPSDVRVWLATGHTEMRRGFGGLALIAQGTLRRDLHSGHLIVFRGRRGPSVGDHLDGREFRIRIAKLARRRAIGKAAFAKSRNKLN